MVTKCSGLKRHSAGKCRSISRVLLRYLHQNCRDVYIELHKAVYVFLYDGLKDYLDTKCTFERCNCIDNYKAFSLAYIL